MKIVKYICDECNKTLDRDNVYFFNFKDIHYELCEKCFLKYKQVRKHYNEITKEFKYLDPEKRGVKYE